MPILLRSVDVNFVVVSGNDQYGRARALITTNQLRSDIWLMQSADAELVDYGRVSHTIYNLTLLDDTSFTVRESRDNKNKRNRKGKTVTRSRPELRSWYDRAILTENLALKRQGETDGLGEVVQYVNIAVPNMYITAGANMLIRGRLYRDRADLYTPQFWQASNIALFGGQLVSSNTVRGQSNMMWWLASHILETLGVLLPFRTRIMFRRKIYPSYWTHAAVRALPTQRWGATGWSWLNTGVEWITLYPGYERPVTYIAETSIIEMDRTMYPRDITPDIFMLALLCGMVVDKGQNDKTLRIGVIM